MSKDSIQTFKIDQYTNKETARLIRLLWQREEYMALPEENYFELLDLLKKELVRTENLDW